MTETGIGDRCVFRPGQHGGFTSRTTVDRSADFRHRCPASNVAAFAARFYCRRSCGSSRRVRLAVDAATTRKTRCFDGAFEFDEKVSRAFFKPNRLAPEFPPSRISEARVNGGIGLSDDFDPGTWQLRVGGLAGRTDDLVLGLDDIRQLPRTEMTTELKCIEGWSIVVHWAGTRFSDFRRPIFTEDARRQRTPDPQNRPENLVPFVALSTPDEGYYVGWDMASILHPQTLLVYEMNGAPLTPEHGAPLRLASATKYGIKQIKRIGRIEFTSERPRDYWAEEGYDWYAGH